MAKADNRLFICEQCGARFAKWSGKCTNCGSWNSLIETAQSAGKSTTKGRALNSNKISDIETNAADRITSGFTDLDLVLGGGFTKSGVYLLGGQPGAGKSTLLLQLLSLVQSQKLSTLYVSGEESAGQIASRAKRLEIPSDLLDIAISNSADDICATIESRKFDLVIVDSIQTVQLSSVGSAAGTVSQISNSAHALISAAKSSGTTLIMVGHITKEGNIAGPKLLEHLVDAVLQLEVETDELRFLRASKNRYGPTTELAIFEMKGEGLRLLKNPSKYLLSERQNSDGSVVLATLDGHRPLLVEVQALVNKTNFGYPKRTAVGFDINRLNIIIAILEKHTNLKLNAADIYINVVGGLKVREPGADLAIAMAIASASTGYKVAGNAVVFGELGLVGEIRGVVNTDRRCKEALSQGFDSAIAPKVSNSKFIKSANGIKQYLNLYLQSGK